MPEAATATLTEPRTEPGVEAVEVPPATPAIVSLAIVSLAQSGKLIDCTEGDFLLDVAEAAGVDLDSSCRSGSCGTCRQKLLEGSITYEGDPQALDANDQAQGYVLTCIGRPVGRVVLDC
ncbi:MAG: 2Fe-2S iron-sulfur cluster-binding protein [Thermosynechococcaceae cyanobacterium MS004]|nr:2Fe-2S iron-sulfur cluster-binding protein [Thermosynechococcaceae cyanobacterium MS004]